MNQLTVADSVIYDIVCYVLNGYSTGLFDFDKDKNFAKCLTHINTLGETEANILQLEEVCFSSNQLVVWGRHYRSVGKGLATKSLDAIMSNKKVCRRVVHALHRHVATMPRETSVATHPTLVEVPSDPVPPVEPSSAPALAPTPTPAEDSSSGPIVESALVLVRNAGRAPGLVPPVEPSSAPAPAEDSSSGPTVESALVSARNAGRAPAPALESAMVLAAGPAPALEPALPLVAQDGYGLLNQFAQLNHDLAVRLNDNHMIATESLVRSLREAEDASTQSLLRSLREADNARLAMLLQAEDRRMDRLVQLLGRNQPNDAIPDDDDDV